MELIAQKREIFGKKAKSLRQDGLIPAELYGRDIENLHLSISASDFKRIFKQAGESAIINILISSPIGKDQRPVLVYDVQKDPFTDQILNVDFYQVRMDEKIRTKAPFEFVGESPAVKDGGGILVKAMQEIEIEVLPNQIPHAIPVELGRLMEIDQSIYVKDLIVPEGIKVLVAPESVIATVKAPITEEEEQKMAQETTVESVAVETEEKKAERLAKEEADRGAESKEAK